MEKHLLSNIHQLSELGDKKVSVLVTSLGNCVLAGK